MQLLKQGVEQVKDANGTYNKGADAILYLNGDEVIAQSGAQVRLDAGQDAEVPTESPFYYYPAGSDLRIRVDRRIASSSSRAIGSTSMIRR